VGQQPEVPAPGKNEKRVVYGGVDYKTGDFTYTIAATKCGAEFLVFLLALLKRYAGQKIILVCDNGRFHATKAVHKFLTAHRDHLRVFWLLPYSPSLNLIERLWGHIKRTVLANTLYATLDDREAAFRRSAKGLTGDRDKMGSMFDHDDLNPKNKPPRLKRAA
jgi:transposase